MKIAYVVTRSDAVGGAQIHIRDVSLSIREQGHEPVVVVQNGGPWVAQLREKGIAVHEMQYLQRSIRPLRDLMALLELRRTLKEIRPDLVSTHTAKAGFLGRLAARSLGIPVIFTAHGWTFTEGVPRLAGMLWKVLERFAGRYCDAIITVSRFDRALAVGAGVGDPSRIVAVHNGMPDDGRSAQKSQERRAPVITMVARFEQQKDHLTLIRALSLLVEQPWSVQLVGDGPTAAEVVDEVHKLNLNDRVAFLGSRPDVAKILEGSDIFVLATHYEGLPRSIIEAMRAGLPVVATDVAGISELVDDGRSGYLVRRSDVKDLAFKLSSLLNSPSIRASFGAAGRARFEQMFRFETMLDRTLLVYKSVVARRQNPSAALVASRQWGA